MGGTIVIQKPHVNQYQILNNRKRFNYLRCGRRFGKTSLISYLIAEKLRDRVGIFAPTYKDLSEIWLEVKYRFKDVIESKNEQTKQIILTTGGTIDFWSIEDPSSGRGRKYHRIIIDEAEKCKKLEEAYEMNLRFTLVDFQGDAWLFTTPKGLRTYFDKLFTKAKEKEDSATFQYTTADNPHIPREEIAELMKLDDRTLQQEFYGNAVDWGSDSRFIYAYNKDKHLSKEVLEVERGFIYLSFDFNVNPQTCIAGQFDQWHKKVRILKEYRIANAGVHEICERIKTDFEPDRLIVTGDASGWNRDKMVRGFTCHYDIIAKELGLRRGQIKAPKSNPLHTASRTVTNSLLDRHPDYLFNDCPYLLEDLQTVEANVSGGIKKEQGMTGHLLDCFLYFNWTFLRSWVTGKK